MSVELVLIVAIVSVVAIVAIVFGRSFRAEVSDKRAHLETKPLDTQGESKDGTKSSTGGEQRIDSAEPLSPPKQANTTRKKNNAKRTKKK